MKILKEINFSTSLIKVIPSVENPKVLQSKILFSRIALPMITGKVFVKFEQMSYCRAESNYTQIVLRTGEKILVSKTLKWVSERCPKNQFLRIHGSYLVNAELIKIVCSNHLVLESGERIPVSRRKKRALMDTLSRGCAPINQNLRII